jgi:hypothetical protein
MIAGPQVITAFFLATGERYAANSAAYIGGAAIAVIGWVSAAFLVVHISKNAGHHTANKTLDWIVLGLLLVLIVHAFTTRKQSEPPKWMRQLAHENPKSAFLLGLNLFLLFPGDILTAITVGLYVGRHGESWWHVLPFVVLTLLILALPALGVALLGRRADVVLPKVREWMNQHSWIVSEVVLVIFVVIIINSLA